MFSYNMVNGLHCQYIRFIIETQSKNSVFNHEYKITNKQNNTTCNLALPYLYAYRPELNTLKQLTFFFI